MSLPARQEWGTPTSAHSARGRPINLALDHSDSLAAHPRMSCVVDDDRNTAISTHFAPTTAWIGNIIDVWPEKTCDPWNAYADEAIASGGVCLVHCGEASTRCTVTATPPTHAPCSALSSTQGGICTIRHSSCCLPAALCCARQGISRAPTLVLAYLLLKHGCSLLEATASRTA